MSVVATAEQSALDRAITCGVPTTVGSAHLGADAIEELRELGGDGVDRSRARLEDGGGVEGDPAEAHGLEGGDAGEHGVVIRVEGPARRVAGRWGNHALQADGGG